MVWPANYNIMGTLANYHEILADRHIKPKDPTTAYKLFQKSQHYKLSGRTRFSAVYENKYQFGNTFLYSNTKLELAKLISSGKNRMSSK